MRISHRNQEIQLLLPEVEERLNPNIDLVRAGSRAHARRHGLRSRTADVDYAWLCALMLPDLDFHRLQLAANVVGHWFHFDDRIDESLAINAALRARARGLASPTERERICSLIAGLERRRERTLALFAGRELDGKSDAPELDSSCRELAAQLRELDPRPDQRALWLRTLAAYYGAVIEAKRAIHMDLRTYLRLREDTGAAPALIALGLLLTDARAVDDPADLAGIQLAGLLTSLHNDLFSLKADVAVGQRENIVDQAEGLIDAQSQINELMRAYLRARLSPAVEDMCDAMIVANVRWSLGGRHSPAARRYQ